MDDLISRVEAALEGVTPGPWVAEGPDHSLIVWSDFDHRVCFMTSDGPAAANARFIAAARDLVPELAAKMREVTAEKAAIGRELNRARYGDPDFSWEIHKDAVHDLKAELARLRAAIIEATEPDFLFGAMDNVHDMDVTVDDYAAAVSRAAVGVEDGE